MFDHSNKQRYFTRVNQNLNLLLANALLTGAADGF
jgi:hypothetical protein